MYKQVLGNARGNLTKVKIKSTKHTRGGGNNQTTGKNVLHTTLIKIVNYQKSNLRKQQTLSNC